MKRIALIFLLVFPYLISAQNDCIPSRPNRLVNDYTQTLSTAQQSHLEQKLRRYNDTTSTQIAIAILPNTCGDEIKFFATEVAHKWGVGQADEDNGCIILLSMDDREIAIQNGYGLEEFLTDAMTKRVIETVIIPEFKRGDYYSGLNKGTDAIFQVLAGEFKGDGGSSPGNPKFPFFAIIIVIFIILSIIRNRGGGKGRGGYRGGYWIGGFGTGGFGGGGGGFSGGGGGFGGFGGGGFGGGGASGSW